MDFLIGETVKEVRLGPSVRIVFAEGELVEPALYLDLGRYTIFTAAGEPHEQDESRPTDLGQSLALVGKRVAATSTTAAVLELMFSDGSKLCCEPSTEYEAWQVVGGDPTLVWATTEGDVDAA